MSTLTRYVRMSPLAVLVAALALGCASTGPSKTVGPNDLPSLAGRWDGTLTLPSGRSERGTMTLSPGGEYVVMAGSFSAGGQAHVREGGLLFVNATTTGGGGAVTGPRVSSATLSQRPDGSLVLTGYGHSGTGPFSYELVRSR